MRSSISIEVDVDIDDVLQGMDREEIAQLARDEGFIVVPKGQGDDELRENTIERAYLAARRMTGLPREIADLFWHVHERAL